MSEPMTPAPRIERRAHVRLTPQEFNRPLFARIAHGPMLTLIDLSAGGALIEAPERMTPGAHLVIEFMSEGHQQTARMPSRVLRSTLVSILDVPRYRGACAFKRLLSLPELIAGPPGGVHSAGA